jgi:hypothetical protein
MGLPDPAVMEPKTAINLEDLALQAGLLGQVDIWPGVFQKGIKLVYETGPVIEGHAQLFRVEMIEIGQVAPGGNALARDRQTYW